MRRRSGLSVLPLVSCACTCTCACAPHVPRVGTFRSDFYCPSDIVDVDPARTGWTVETLRDALEQGSRPGGVPGYFTNDLQLPAVTSKRVRPPVAALPSCSDAPGTTSRAWFRFGEFDSVTVIHPAPGALKGLLQASGCEGFVLVACGPFAVRLEGDDGELLFDEEGPVCVYASNPRSGPTLHLDDVDRSLVVVGGYVLARGRSSDRHVGVDEFAPWEPGPLLMAGEEWRYWTRCDP